MLKEIQCYYIKIHFKGSKMCVSNTLRLFLIDIDEIFPVQSSEFTKSLYFGSHLKKKNWNKLFKKNIFT